MPSVQEQKTTVKPPVVPSVSSATPHCEPHKSVVMIKTHKSGSSTLQNILLRKAESEDLKVALPRDGPYLKDNLGFHRDVIYLDDGERKYNILASHMHLSTQEFPGKKALGKAKHPFTCSNSDSNLVKKKINMFEFSR